LNAQKVSTGQMMGQVMTLFKQQFWTRQCYAWVVTPTKNWLLSNSLISAYKATINIPAEHNILLMI
jgi:hypothetical protein